MIKFPPRPQAAHPKIPTRGERSDILRLVGNRESFWPMQRIVRERLMLSPVGSRTRADVRVSRPGVLCFASGTHGSGRNLSPGRIISWTQALKLRCMDGAPSWTLRSWSHKCYIIALVLFPWMRRCRADLAGAPPPPSIGNGPSNTLNSPKETRATDCDNSVCSVRLTLPAYHAPQEDLHGASPSPVRFSSSVARNSTPANGSLCLNSYTFSRISTPRKPLFLKGCYFRQTPEWWSHPVRDGTRLWKFLNACVQCSVAHLREILSKGGDTAEILAEGVNTTVVSVVVCKWATST